MEWWITRWILFCIRYSRFFWVYLKKNGDNINKASVQIYVNKTENKVTFKIKNGYCLALLTPETIKLVGSTK